MRLIDADALITEIANMDISEQSKIFSVNMLRNTPTAYDVEKVLADVKEENKRALKEMYKIHGNQYTTILLKKHNDKIDDIVSNGGKEQI